MAEQPPPEEDDHDLLSPALAGDRLARALDDEQRALSRAEGAGDAAAAAASRERLAELREAADRHARPVPATESTFYSAGPPT